MASVVNKSLTIPFPAEHPSVSKIEYAKKICGFKLAPCGEVRIYFKSDELMEKFPTTDFKDLGAVWIAHMKQDHQLEVIFYDPNIDQYKTIDRALLLFTKHLGIEQ